MPSAGLGIGGYQWEQLLKARKSYFRHSSAWWDDILGLAYLFGWKPVHRGTGIHTEDARSLADILEGTLPDIPNHTIRRPHYRDYDDWNPHYDDWNLPHDDRNPLESFSGPHRKAMLKAFIEFCREGGFQIWY
jgi:hypothetical protein